MLESGFNCQGIRIYKIVGHAQYVIINFKLLLYFHHEFVLLAIQGRFKFIIL
jgi:hypothetical protein